MGGGGHVARLSRRTRRAELGEERREGGVVLAASS
jgi:hypothetical protein